MVIVAIGMIVTSCGKGVSTNVSLKSDVDSAFYAVGVSWGTGMREQLKSLPGTDGKINDDAFLAGLAAAFRDEATIKITYDNAQIFLQTYVEETSMREAETTRAEGEAFLASNKTKEGVITTQSGLQYKVLTEGSGRKPTTEDRVIVHYTGKILDGSVFDSTMERGEPVIFPVTGVIPGWIEGLQIMPVGSKYMFWIPSDLAYGPQQVSELIKANSMLEFEVELLGIEGEE